jgi:hypothetical protein
MSQIMSKVSGGDTKVMEGDRIFFMWRSQLLDQLQKAKPNERETVYGTFIQQHLDPKRVRTELMKFKPSMSIVPVGMYPKLFVDSIHSYYNIAEQVKIHAQSVLSGDETEAMVKVAKLADTADPDTRERARIKLRQMYYAAQRRLFKKSPQPDMVQEWSRELPFQWYSLEANIAKEPSDVR